MLSVRSQLEIASRIQEFHVKASTAFFNWPTCLISHFTCNNFERRHSNATNYIITSGDLTTG